MTDRVIVALLAIAAAAVIVLVVRREHRIADAASHKCRRVPDHAVPPVPLSFRRSEREVRIKTDVAFAAIVGPYMDLGSATGLSEAWAEGADRMPDAPAE